MKTKVFRTKFLLSGLTLVVISCLLFFSCQKNEIEQINESFDYELIGIEHNKGLDYALNKLKKGINKNSQLKNNNITNILDLSENINLDFCINESTLNFTNITKNSDRVKLFSSVIQNRSLKSDIVQKLYPKDYEKYLTKMQIILLEKVMRVIYQSNSLKKEDVIKKFRQIETEAKSNCTSKESAIILIACSVGRNSYIYWDENYINWMSELGNGLNTKKIRLKYRSIEDDINAENNVLYGDIYGAVSGFLYGAYVGGTAGTVILPGVGTVTGAIVGGLGDATVSAIMGSVGGALWNIFN